MANYASNQDVQSWLGQDKIDVTDQNASKVKIDADRLIRGYLTGVFTPVTIAGWTTPDNTPEMIRGIAGRLSAAFLYRSIYSEEQEAIPEYAQELYNEAIALLEAIKTGNIVVIDPITGGPVDSSAGGQLEFFPDGTTVPVFTMDQVFS